MFDLKKTNGDITIGDLTITASLSTKDMEFLEKKYAVYLSVVNAGYISYRITDLENGETAISLMFYKEKIQYISIGCGKNCALLPFGMTDGEKKEIKRRLTLIGGEYLYPWGEVSYNEDPRGGNVSILIKYQT